MFAVVLLALVASSAAKGIPGGWTEQNPNSKEYTDLAWSQATPAINKEANSGEYALVPVKVVSASTQVVAGENIALNIQVAPSKCKKTDKITLSACPPNANAATEEYRVVIFSQPWTNTLQVTSVTSVKEY